MPKLKTLPIDFIDGGRTASYGMPEMRELAKITGVNPYVGSKWSCSVTPDNVAAVICVLLKRDDPSLTVEKIEDEILSPEHTDNWLDLFFRLDMGKTKAEVEQLGKGPAAATPLTVGPPTEPSAASVSV